MVTRFPPVLGLSFDENVAPALHALTARLGLSEPTELRRVVLGMPTLLGLSFEGNVEPTRALPPERCRLSAAA